MDSGYLEANEDLDDEYDVLQSLSPPQVIGVMDAMLCAEVREPCLISLMLASLTR